MSFRFYLTGGLALKNQGASLCMQVDLAQQVPDLDNRDAWISSISFALDLDALCITTSGGHLLLLDPESKTVDEARTLHIGNARPPAIMMMVHASQHLIE